MEKLYGHRNKTSYRTTQLDFDNFNRIILRIITMIIWSLKIRMTLGPWESPIIELIMLVVAMNMELYVVANQLVLWLYMIISEEAIEMPIVNISSKSYIQGYKLQGPPAYEGCISKISDNMHELFWMEKHVSKVLPNFNGITITNR